MLQDNQWTVLGAGHLRYYHGHPHHILLLHLLCDWLILLYAGQYLSWNPTSHTHFPGDSLLLCSSPGNILQSRMARNGPGRNFLHLLLCSGHYSDGVQASLFFSHQEEASSIALKEPAEQGVCPRAPTGRHPDSFQLDRQRREREDGWARQVSQLHLGQLYQERDKNGWCP